MQSSRRLLCALVSLLIVLALSPAPVRAQSPPEQEVVDAVQGLFDAMAARDAEALAALVMAEGRVVAMRGETDSGTPGGTSLADFVAAISSSQGELLERMWEPEVIVDGAIAFLRAPYDFYRDGVFSHCGVDHVSLVRAEDGWRIASIVYTVQRDGCAPSPLGPPR